jgi:SAM-dependent methyltransferase
MAPHGAAIIAYLQGDSDAQLVIRRDDGFETLLPVDHFFRPPSEFSPIERAALDRCAGSVLDVGAGTGLHSLVLQAGGTNVTAIDICAPVVEVMKRRGVLNARCADVLRCDDGPFDTILLLGHGVGIFENLQGLGEFLVHARDLLEVNGQLLLHSMDVRQTQDEVHLAYHEANRQAGRYIGETRIQLEYAGECGPYCGWLHVDAETLRVEAQQFEWECDVVAEQEGGEYLAKLTAGGG